VILMCKLVRFNRNLLTTNQKADICRRAPGHRHFTHTHVASTKGIIYTRTREQAS